MQDDPAISPQPVNPPYETDLVQARDWPAETRILAELRRRDSQHAAAAQLGQLALSGAALPSLMNQAAKLICQTLEVEYCSLLRLSADSRTLHCQAGDGWPEVVEEPALEVAPETLAGFSLLANETVIVNDWQTEQRFHLTPRLHQLQIVSSLSVQVPDVERPYGVLNVHTATSKCFSAEDGSFLQSIANILASAIARLRSEASLRESKARLLEAQRIASMGHWVHDLVAPHLYWSEGVYQIFGIEQGQFSSDYEGFLRCVHPADRELMRSLHNAVLAGEEALDVEHRIIRPSGELRVVHARGKSTRDEHGKVIRLVGTVLDITEQKHKEEELRQAVYQTELYARQLRGLTEASLLINQAGALNQTLQAITEQARQIIGAHQSVTSLTLDQNWAQSINAVSLSDKYAEWRAYRELPDGGGIYSLVCGLNQPLRLTQEELEAHPAWSGFSEHAAQHPPMRGWLAAPLVGRAGRSIGLIQLSDKYEGEFSANDETILMQLAQIASVAVENARLFQNVKEAEAHLNAQLNFTAAISDSLVEGICALDQQGRIIFINPAAERMLGWSNAKIYGRFIREFTHALTEQVQLPLVNVLTDSIIDSQVKEVLRTGGIIHSDEYFLAHPEGYRFPISYTLSPFHLEAEQRGVLLAFHDITETKLAKEQLLNSREQLRALSARLNTAREEEGARIAREIHDQLGGAMTGLKWDLDELEQLLAAYPGQTQAQPAARKLAAMNDLIDATIDTVRKISSELHPGILDDLGLLPAIEWQAQQFQTRTGIVCQCNFQLDQVDLGKAEATAVFRIFQETLTNVLRHAQASQVEINVARDAAHLVFAFQDNGKGITEREKGNRSSLGLLGMQERARLAGGQVVITGNAAQGTTVTIYFPCAKFESG